MRRGSVTNMGCHCSQNLKPSLLTKPSASRNLKFSPLAKTANATARKTWNRKIARKPWAYAYNPFEWNLGQITRKTIALTVAYSQTRGWANEWVRLYELFCMQSDPDYSQTMPCVHCSFCVEFGSDCSQNLKTWSLAKPKIVTTRKSWKAHCSQNSKVPLVISQILKSLLVKNSESSPFPAKALKCKSQSLKTSLLANAIQLMPWLLSEIHTISSRGCKQTTQPAKPETRLYLQSCRSLAWNTRCLNPATNCNVWTGKITRSTSADTRYHNIKVMCWNRLLQNRCSQIHFVLHQLCPKPAKLHRVRCRALGRSHLLRVLCRCKVLSTADEFRNLGDSHLI